jgi:pimeloyl-ACP methyl ester carboxylesterase
MAKTVQKVQKEALQTPLEGIIASLKGMKLRKDRTFILQNKKFKNLLILGKQDAVLPYTETAKTAQNTNTKLIIVAGGHMSHLENTTEVFEAITTYLNT